LLPTKTQPTRNKYFKEKDPGKAGVFYYLITILGLTSTCKSMGLVFRERSGDLGLLMRRLVAVFVTCFFVFSGLVFASPALAVEGQAANVFAARVMAKSSGARVLVTGLLDEFSTTMFVYQPVFMERYSVIGRK